MAVIKQTIVPHLWFDREAKEAADFYCSVFPDKNHEHHYASRHAVGRLRCCFVYALWPAVHGYQRRTLIQVFNESISFMVYCDTQEEIDYFWEKLSAVPEAEQCGWLKDKYGLSWQIVPTAMDNMMREKDPERLTRITQALLKTKKFDLAALQRAYGGK